MDKEDDEDDNALDDALQQRLAADVQTETDALWRMFVDRVRQLWWVPVVCVLAVGVAVYRVCHHLWKTGPPQYAELELPAVLFFAAFAAFTVTGATRELYVWWRMLRLLHKLRRIARELRASNDENWSEGGYGDG